MAKIVSVNYPSKIIKYGILSSLSEEIYFQPIDKRFPKMIVRRISANVFD